LFDLNILSNINHNCTKDFNRLKMAKQIDPLEYELIRNIIALYAIALDTKEFDGLKTVFTEDVDTVYPMGNLKGRQNVIDAIEKRSLHPIDEKP
jgi:hypothetical protein